MITSVFLFLSLAGAANVQESTISKKAHFSIRDYSVNRATNSKSLQCKAFANLSDQGVKLKLKHKSGRVFALDCRASEVGSQWDLVVFKGSQVLTTIKDVASEGGDCGISYESQSWLEDRNEDGHFDLIRRSKMKEIPADCGTGKPAARSKDELKVYYWNEESRSFGEGKVSEEEEKGLRRKYDFEMF